MRNRYPITPAFAAGMLDVGDGHRVALGGGGQPAPASRR